MATTRTVQANGIELFLREQGEGPLVLLCHGWPELAYSWRHQMPALAAAGYRVVAPDMRGYGGTEAPEQIDQYSMMHLVGDMAELVKALGETKAVIRGFQDGEYNVTYDSIPFADTNNPTHHSTAFFPSNTIETVVVDRGPGNGPIFNRISQRL